MLHPYSRYLVRHSIFSHIGHCLPSSLQIDLRLSHVPFFVQAGIFHRILIVRFAHSVYLQIPSLLFFFLFFNFRSESPYPPGLPLPNCHRRSAHGAHSSVHFRTGTGTTTVPEVMTVEPFVFVPSAEQMRMEMRADSVPGAAASPNTTLTVPARTRSKDVQAGYRLSWHRPVDASMGLFD